MHKPAHDSEMQHTGRRATPWWKSPKEMFWLTQTDPIPCTVFYFCIFIIGVLANQRVECAGDEWCETDTEVHEPNGPYAAFGMWQCSRDVILADDDLLANRIPTFAVGVSVALFLSHAATALLNRAASATKAASVVSALIFAELVIFYTLMLQEETSVLCSLVQLGDGDSLGSEVRIVYPVRYFVWLATGPALTSVLGKLSGLPRRYTLGGTFCISASAILGFLAALHPTTPSIFASCAALAVLNVSGVCAFFIASLRAVHRAATDSRARRLILVLGPIAMLTYLLIGGMSLLNYSNVLSPSQEYITWPLLDVLSMGLFCQCFVAADSISDSETIHKQLQLVEVERKSADASNQAKRKFMRYIFHELRVPLNAITLGLDDMHETGKDASEALTTVEAVFRLPPLPSSTTLIGDDHLVNVRHQSAAERDGMRHRHGHAFDHQDSSAIQLRVISDDEDTGTGTTNSSSSRNSKHRSGSPASMSADTKQQLSVHPSARDSGLSTPVPKQTMTLMQTMTTRPAANDSRHSMASTDQGGTGSGVHTDGSFARNASGAKLNAKHLETGSSKQHVPQRDAAAPDVTLAVLPHAVMDRDDYAAISSSAHIAATSEAAGDADRKAQGADVGLNDSGSPAWDRVRMGSGTQDSSKPSAESANTVALAMPTYQSSSGLGGTVNYSSAADTDNNAYNTTDAVINGGHDNRVTTLDTTAEVHAAHAQLSRGLTSMRDTVALLMGSATAMGKLLGDFLLLEKIEEGKFDIEAVSFRLLDMVREGASLFAVPLQAKRIQLLVEVKPGLPAVIRGDVHKLRQVLCNYISNAIKFSNPGSTITVRISLVKVRAEALSDQAPSIVVEDAHGGILAENAHSVPSTSSDDSAADDHRISSVIAAGRRAWRGFWARKSPAAVSPYALQRRHAAAAPQSHRPAAAQLLNGQRSGGSSTVDGDNSSSQVRSTSTPPASSPSSSGASGTSGIMRRTASAASASRMGNAAAPGPSVTFAAAPAQMPKRTTCIRIAVIDAGPGISPEDQAKLFQPFNQIKAGALQKGNGTGLGLSICKRIIELSGGRVGVQSKEGKGSVFYFEVPVAGPPEKEGSSVVLHGDGDVVSKPEMQAGRIERPGSGAPRSTDAATAPQATQSSRGPTTPSLPPANSPAVNSDDDDARTPSDSWRVAADVDGGSGAFLLEVAEGSATSFSPSSPDLRIGFGASSQGKLAAHGRSSGDPVPKGLGSENSGLRLTGYPSQTGASLETVRVAIESLSPRFDILASTTLLTTAVVVDDVKSNRDFFGRMLSRRGVSTIHFAEDGLQAVGLLSSLSLAQVASIQCWFLDKEMPVCDGHGAATQLRARGVNVPIFGVTGNALAEDRAEFIAAGVNAVIPKPVRAPELEAALLTQGLRLADAGRRGRA